MGGGKVEQNSQANGKVAFNPVVMGGGNVMVGGNVGNAGVETIHDGKASGASVGIKAAFSMPGMPELQLVNLNDIGLMNLDSNTYHATYDKETHNHTNEENIQNDTTNVHEVLKGKLITGSQFMHKNNVNDGI